MSSQTVRKGAAPRRTVNRRRPVARKPLGDRIIDKLPFGHDTLRRLVTWSLLGLGGAAVIAVVNWMGVPQRIGVAVAETAADAGLRVKQVDITGLKRMDRDTVYAVVFENQPSRAMLRVDLVAVRARLLRYGWIKDAYVSRRFPDRLLVHVVEREPAAVWQDQGRLTLIDKDGVLLAPTTSAGLHGLPLMIGPGADRQEAAYQALLAAAPGLSPRVTAASWTANRRWDLTFDTGETLALPQVDPAAALVKFAQMNGAQPLLGRGWRRFDMRLPDKMYVLGPDREEQRTLDGATGVAKADPATDKGDSTDSADEEDEAHAPVAKARPAVHTDEA